MGKSKIFVFFFIILAFFTYSYPQVTANAAGPEGLTAPNILLYSLDAKTAVYSKNADEVIPPGPTVKIMTALVVLENVKDLSAKIAVPKEAVVPNAKNISLKEGELVSIEDLLGAMLVGSANDAALALAYHVGGGSIDKFVEMMNNRAKELGANQTVFVNPTGLDSPAHYTTVNDIARFSLQAALIPKFMDLCSSAIYEILPTNMYSKKRVIYSSNHFISRMVVTDYRYRYAKGINSGYTEFAGHCLVTVAKKGDYEYLCIVMGAEKIDNKIMSYVDAQNLLEWGFNNLEYKKIIDTSDAITELPVTLSSENDHVVLVPAEEVELLLPKDLDVSQIERKVEISESVAAPVKKGDVLGKLTLVYDGKVQSEVNLVALYSVKRSDLLYAQAVVKEFLGSIWVKIFCVFVVVLIILYFLLLIAKNSRPRKRRRKSVRRIDMAKPRR